MKSLHPLRVDGPAIEETPLSLGMAPEMVKQLLLAVVGSALLATVFVGAASFFAGRHVAVSNAPAPIPQALPPAAPTSTPPTCRDMAADIAPIERMAAEGKTALVADLARHYLEDQGPLPLCPSSKQGLSSLSYHASIQAILSVPATDGGHEAYERWMTAEAAAAADDLPAEHRMSTQSILSVAYGLGQWELARGAFIQMWRQGAIVPTDGQQITRYVAILRNWGNVLLRQGAGSQARAEQMLATAQTIADVAGLPIGEPCADLEASGIAHCRSIPPDYGDLVLATLMPGGEDDELSPPVER